MIHTVNPVYPKSEAENSVAYAAPKHDKVNHSNHNLGNHSVKKHAHVFNRAVTEKWTEATCETTGLTAGSHCATCREDGSTVYFCTNGDCEATKVEVIPALGHDLVTVDYKAPTCTEEGNYAYEMCTRCGAKDLSATIPATGHHNIVFDVKEGYEPCGTSFGLADEKCADCGKVVMTNVEICYHGEYSWICTAEECVYTAQVTKR